LGDLADIVDDGVDGFLVVVGFGHVEQFGRLDQAVGVDPDLGDGLLELGAFLAQRLRAFRFVPDRRVFEFPADFLEPL
jgi:hypothetical protein